MKIKHARIRHEQVSITHKVKTAFGTMNKRHAVLLVLEDEDGRRGVGDSWVNFPAWGPWARVAMFEQVFIPRLKGQQVNDIPTFVTQMYQDFAGQAWQSGTMGPFLQALCAIELALWDLAAQRKGVPLAKLIFKKPLDKVQIYASGINTPFDWDLIDEYLERGVRLFKLKLGFGDEEDQRNLESLTKHLGDRAPITVDVNRAWTLDHALTWLDRLKDHNVQWLEEPLCRNDEDKLGVLTQQSLVPIACGENILMPPGCDVDAIADTPTDILQPDLTKYAPLHIALQVLDAAKTKGKRVVPHFLGPGPGQAASLQFAASCNDGLVEYDINRNPLRTNLFEQPFEIQNGAITIPDRPGLGWTLKER